MNEKKKINAEFVLMTNRELTKEFVKGDIEGGRSAGYPYEDYRIVNGEVYKEKKVRKTKLESKK